MSNEVIQVKVEYNTEEWLNQRAIEEYERQENE